MRLLLRKHLLFFPSSCCSCSSPPARTLLLRLQVCEFSSSSSSHPQPHWRRHDDESRNVRVSVWWDFENCNVPAGVNILKVAPAITDAVRANGIKGPIKITAFGDVLQFSRANQEALAFTGIHLAHIPNGGKNSADRSLLVDLMHWVSQNPPPAHLFLISGDRGFAGMLHRLRMNNYNILLAIPGRAPDVLCSAATIMWQWPLLLKGEDLNGKHFNHPPDGPFGSWYGNYKVPLEDPYSAGAEHSASFQNVEICEPSLEAAVPKSVVRHVKRILSKNRNGISIIDLRQELMNCDVRLDKNLYGYKKFSRFLLSIPHVQLQRLGDGHFCVRLVPSESPEPFERNVVPSTISAVKNEERGNAATPKLNGEGKNMDRDADGTTSMASLYERSTDGDSKSFQPVPSQGKPIEEYVDGKSSVPSLVEKHVCQPPNELQKSSLGSEKVADVANAQLSEKDNEVSKTKTGSLKVRSNTTLGKHSAGNDYTTDENNDIADYESGKFKSKDKYENPVEKRPDGSAETYKRSSTFFSWIKSWFPFWKRSAKTDDSTAHQNKVVSNVEDPKLSALGQTVSHFGETKSSELDQDVSHSRKPELFSSGSFWNDMESFVFSPKGSLLFSQSRRREDLAHKLQKHGPMVLRSLTENKIFQLLELLIEEKKWLEESPSQAYPYRLTQPVQKNSSLGQAHGANGLGSLFLTRTPQPNLQKSFEHDVEKHNQSIHQTRVSTPATETKYTERSRNDILADCQKLVNEILKEHPEGYNIGCFRKQFLDRYGYHLDIQKLSYQKLASLLQIMPGVKLESTYMLPSVPAVCASDSETCTLKTQVTNASHADSNSDNELSDSAPKYDNMDSPWEELGPVSVNNANQNDVESKLSQKAKELDKHPDYEPIGANWDYSESEDDSSCSTQLEEQGKAKCNEQDSSFWQALDLWHSSKEGENSVKKSDNIEGLGSSLVDLINSSTESSRGTISKIPSGISREKQRSQKYSFVADPVLPDKDKLIDGILDGFKKADEQKMQN